MKTLTVLICLIVGAPLQLLSQNTEPSQLEVTKEKRNKTRWYVYGDYLAFNKIKRYIGGEHMLASSQYNLKLVEDKAYTISGGMSLEAPIASFMAFKLSPGFSYQYTPIEGYNDPRINSNIGWYENYESKALRLAIPVMLQFHTNTEFQLFFGIGMTADMNVSQKTTGYKEDLSYDPATQQVSAKRKDISFSLAQSYIHFDLSVGISPPFLDHRFRLEFLRLNGLTKTQDTPNTRMNQLGFRLSYRIN